MSSPATDRVDAILGIALARPAPPPSYPPDAHGDRFGSLVHARLAERAARTGTSELVALGQFLAYMAPLGFDHRLCARVESGLAAPEPAFRAAACRYLGLPEDALFAPLPPLGEDTLLAVRPAPG